MWFLNLPEVGGNHLPDVKAMRPVFFEGRLVRLRREPRPLGGHRRRVPGSYVPWATESYQEGLRIAPVRLFTAAGPSAETIDLVLSNLRGREEREGDILAQYAADDVAGAPARRALRAHGAETIARCFERLHAESEAQMRAAIRACPTASWEGEDWLDDDGRADSPPHPTCASTIAGDGPRSTSAERPMRVARPGQHDVLHRVLVGVLRDEGARRARTCRPTTAATGRSRSS